jgi:hypothetical protein
LAKGGRPYAQGFNPPQIIDEKVKNEMKVEFLGNISNRYVQALRDVYVDREKVLWGGDIELRTIGEIHNLKFIVYQYSRDIKGNIRRDPLSKMPIIISNEDQPVGDPKGALINLFLDGGHYETYDPTLNKVGKVLGDGHCLFRAVLQSVKKSNTSTLEEVSVLRNAVADQLKSEIERIDKGGFVICDGSQENNYKPIYVPLTHRDHNPIYIRFSAILEAENSAQLEDAVYDLPPGELVKKALNLYKILK